MTHRPGLDQNVFAPWQAATMVLLISDPAAHAKPRDQRVIDGSASPSPGILVGMTMTTIKVPKATRDRLHRLAAADGVTLAQEIDKLVR